MQKRALIPLALAARHLAVAALVVVGCLGYAGVASVVAQSGNLGADHLRATRDIQAIQRAASEVVAAEHALWRPASEPSEREREHQHLAAALADYDASRQDYESIEHDPGIDRLWGRFTVAWAEWRRLSDAYAASIVASTPLGDQADDAERPALPNMLAASCAARTAALRCIDELDVQHQDAVTAYLANAQPRVSTLRTRLLMGAAIGPMLALGIGIVTFRRAACPVDLPALRPVIPDTPTSADAPPAPELPGRLEDLTIPLPAGAATNQAETPATEHPLTENDGDSACDRFGQIVSATEEIAFQANLLALSASVEAGRSEPAGANNLADEIRHLAMRAADAARESAALVEGAASGEVTHDAVGQSLNDIIAQVGGITKLVESHVGGEPAPASEELIGQTRSVQHLANELASLAVSRG